MRSILAICLALVTVHLCGCGGGSGGGPDANASAGVTPNSFPASGAASATQVLASDSPSSAASTPASASVAAIGLNIQGSSSHAAAAQARSTEAKPLTVAATTAVAADAPPAPESSGNLEGVGPQVSIAAASIASPSTSLPSGIAISTSTPEQSAALATTKLGEVAKTNATTFSRGYYVDSVSGSDLNLGTAEKPWRTLARAASAQLNAGEALLLNCAGKWREPPVEFGSKFAPQGAVLITGYGNCGHTRRPVIYGSTPVTASAWRLQRTAANGAVYVTAMPATVVDVAKGEQLLVRARFPNAVSSTHLSISKSGNTNSRLNLSEADRQGVGSQLLTGAMAVVRSVPWQMESARISGFDGVTGALTLQTPLTKTPAAGAGYFLEGQLWMLDTDGEWFHDPVAGLLYVFLASAPTASDPPIEALHAYTPLTIRGIPKVRVEQVAIVNSGEHGLRILESGDAFISNVVAQRVRLNGIHAQSTTNKASAQGVTIESSTLRDIGAMGIASWLSGTTIRNNVISSVGTQVSSINPIAGIKISEGRSLVTGNTLNGMGFNGISLRNRAEVEISNNTITNVCTRLTDCAGIYSWDSSGAATRSKISRNTVYHVNRAALQGAAGGSPDLLVGIYLDEGTNNMDVTENNIGNAAVGINIHKSSNNLARGNIINVASTAGIRLESSGPSSDSVKANQLDRNTIFVPRYFVSDDLSGPAPRSVGGVAIEVVHQIDALQLLVGPNKTSLTQNVVAHLGDVTSIRYRLRSGSVIRELPSSAWAAYSPSDSYSSPYRSEMARVAGTQLIKDPTLDSGAAAWTSYTYQKGASIVSFGFSTTCGSACASLTPATTNDVLMQVAVPIPDYAKKLMYLRYRALAKSSDTTSKVDVRSNIAPHADAGYLEPATPLPAASERRVEAFFNRTLDSALRISFKGQVGSTLYVDDVQLYAVDRFYLINPLSQARVLTNSGATSQQISCASLGLGSCSVVDEYGKAIGWPLELAPNANKLIFLKSADWTYQ